MAKNRKRANGRNLSLDVSGVAGSGAAGLVKSGDPVVVGELPGVALTDEDADGLATVDTRGVYDLAVDAAADMAPGDVVYFAAGDTPRLSDTNTGARFGYVLEEVTAAGGSQTVEVRIGY